MKIGIDFGTCFSSIGFMNGRRPVTNILDDRNNSGIPTLFMYSKSKNEELYGYDCTTFEAIINNKDVVRYMKKMVRDNPNNLNKIVTSGGKNFTIREILKKYLKYLIAQSQVAATKSFEFESSYIENITITTPVAISSGSMTSTDYKQLLVDTIKEITGLDYSNINVVEEPVAAAI